jgi:multidrug efflux pump subunit AcrA (membrane-fusion protein)
MLAALIFLQACRHGNSTAQASAKNTTSQSNVPVKVTTAPAVAKTVPVTIRATGSFTATESSDVSPQVSGQVVATPVNVGDVVKAGEVIARLDDRHARAKLQQASA